MKLSIIIVNYNVKYFLLQLLESLERSKTTFDREVIVVDNASTDGSMQLVSDRFPEIITINNEENVGFSKANNQGIRISRGKYVLLLNPDTIVQEETLESTVQFMEAHPEAGALGCRMIDGAGNYLPESKRSLPTPVVAFYKAFGFASLFPTSKKFNAYYLGHLPENEVHEVEVLTGAFMLMPREVLNQVGFLDEQFFMYGEDIDLSYRIFSAGYKIYYFPRTSIIHFKGESTRKDSLTYIRNFYRAMIVFARKHYSGRKASMLGVTLNLAIYFRAVLSLLRRVFRQFGLLMLEWGLIVGSLIWFSNWWAGFYFQDPGYYEGSFIRSNIILYATIWIMTFSWFGAYEKPFNWSRQWKGLAVGWLIIATIYGLLGPMLRPSRALIVVSGPIVAVLVTLVRIFYHKYIMGYWPLSKGSKGRYVIVGEEEEALRISSLVHQNRPELTLAGRVTSQTESMQGESLNLGSLQHLDQIVRFHHVDEIIFSSRSVPSSDIMQWMTKLGARFRFKIAPDQSHSVIGSMSKNLPGELYTYDIAYNLDAKYLLRNKRILDVFFALLFLILSPILILFINERSGLFKNIRDVLMGKSTWVGYLTSNEDHAFPRLRPGILGTLLMKDPTGGELAHDADFLYARDYNLWKDVTLIATNIKSIGCQKN